MKGGIKMPYAKLLNDMMTEKGYTNIEVIRKCKEIGIKIDESYFSKLTKETSNIIPSEKISIAIAKALRNRRKNICY